MIKEELIGKVDGIIAVGTTDDECAHIAEDTLHLELIYAFCPDWVKEEVKRLSEADFCRWHA